MRLLRVGIVAAVVGANGCNHPTVYDLPSDGGLDATRDASSDGSPLSDAAGDALSDVRDASTD